MPGGRAAAARDGVLAGADGGQRPVAVSRKDFVDGQPENQAVLDAIDFVWDSGEKRGR